MGNICNSVCEPSDPGADRGARDARRKEQIPQMLQAQRNEELKAEQQQAVPALQVKISHSLYEAINEDAKVDSTPLPAEKSLSPSPAPTPIQISEQRSSASG